MLQTAKIAAVRGVVAAAPDEVLRQLETALRADGGGGRVALVHDLVECELNERGVRDGVFAPLLALCARPRHAAGRRLFPSTTPARLWTALKAAASEDTQILLAGGAPEGFAPVQNRLCLRAAAGLRDGEDVFIAAAAELDHQAAARLIVALEIAPLARAVLEQSPTWLARATGAHVAAMRLAYGDAERLEHGAGPLLMEMLLAAADQPWDVLPLIAWVTDRAEERYVAQSELAHIPTRLIDGLGAAVAALEQVDFANGPEAGLQAARLVERGLATAAALEKAFGLKRGPWADQVRRHRAALTGAAEKRLREAASLVSAVLPPPPVKIAGRALGGGGRFEAPPDAATLLRGRALLTFLSETHAAAETGGFATLWARTAKTVDDRLATAADELVGMLHAGLGGTRPLQGCLDVAAELTAAVRGPGAAGAIRRRAAAA